MRKPSARQYLDNVCKGNVAKCPPIDIDGKKMKITMITYPKFVMLSTAKATKSKSAKTTRSPPRKSKSAKTTRSPPRKSKSTKSSTIVEKINDKNVEMFAQMTYFDWAMNRAYFDEYDLWKNIKFKWNDNALKFVLRDNAHHFKDVEHTKKMCKLRPDIMTPNIIQWMNSGMKISTPRFKLNESRDRWLVNDVAIMIEEKDVGKLAKVDENLIKLALVGEDGASASMLRKMNRPDIFTQSVLKFAKRNRDFFKHRT